MVKRLFLFSVFVFCFLLQAEAADTTIKGTGTTSATAGLEVTDSADTSLLYIRNDGNVGIGTTGPGYNFEVEESGTTASTEYLLGAFDQVTSGGGVYLGYYVGAGGSVQEGRTRSGGSIPLALGTSAYPQAIYVLNSGDVGIGTTGPLSKLHVSTGVNVDAGTISFILGGTVANSRQMVITKDTTTPRLLSIFSSGSTTQSPMAFFTATNTERMRIDTGGNVGIGTTSPNANAILDVTSTSKAFMPPRMTTAQRDAIASPTAGMVIYNSTTNKLNVYTTTWEVVTSL